MGFKETVAEKFGMALFKVKEASPELLLILGIGSMGAAVISGIMAARKHDAIIDEHNERLEIAKATHIVVTDDEEATDVNIHEEELRVLNEKEVARNVRKVYCRTAAQMVKLYAPTVALMALSTACLLKGHSILNDRYTGACTAYMGLKKAKDLYENRNIELNGEESHKMCKYGWHEEEIEDPVTGEKKKIKVANEAEDMINEAKKANGYDNAFSNSHPWAGEFIFVFSKLTSTVFYGNKSMDMSTLNAVENAMNSRLETVGFVVINDVLDALGIDRIPEGICNGWVKGCGGRIELGHMNPINNRWIAGYQTNEIILDMSKNVHGDVFWLLEHKRIKEKEALKANGVDTEAAA